MHTTHRLGVHTYLHSSLHLEKHEGMINNIVKSTDLVYTIDEWRTTVREELANEDNDDNNTNNKNTDNNDNTSDIDS